MTTYDWDSRNRLVTIDGPNLSASFEYDILGRRISKAINGLTTKFQYDGRNIISEITGSNVGVSYLRGLVLDDTFIRLSVSNEYFNPDSIGSIVSLSGDSGTVQTAYEYEPFGKDTVQGATSNFFGYTGRENDKTGLYYYRARYYSPLLRRFISRETLETAGVGGNLYAYVDNSPINFSDPEGLIRLVPPGIRFIPRVPGPPPPRGAPPNVGGPPRGPLPKPAPPGAKGQPPLGKDILERKSPLKWWQRAGDGLIRLFSQFKDFPLGGVPGGIDPEKLPFPLPAGCTPILVKFGEGSNTVETIVCAETST